MSGLPISHGGMSDCCIQTLEDNEPGQPTDGTRRRCKSCGTPLIVLRRVWRWDNETAKQDAEEFKP